MAGEIHRYSVRAYEHKECALSASIGFRSLPVMWTLLLRLLQHGGRKLLVVAVVVVVALGGGALYLAAEGERQRLERDAVLYRQRLEEVGEAVGRWEAEARRQAELARLAALRLQATEQRMRQLQTIIQRLLSVVGLAEAEQQEMAGLAQQRKELERQQAGYGEGAAEAARRVTALAEERTLRAEELERVEQLRTARDVLQAKVRDYLAAAWERYGTWVLWVVFLLLAGPTLWRLFLYYGWAPWVAWAPPVVLDTPAADGSRPPRPVTRGGGVSHSVTLAGTDEVLVKERFLQSSDIGCRKRTRFVLDWRYPFTSAASGLIELIHLTPDIVLSGAPVRVTFSTVDETTTELLEVDLPEGTSLVVRPRFVAGLIRPVGGAGGTWRARWRVGSLHAWITLQFRYFEVRGPVRLLLWGARGVRCETVEGGRARRTNADSTIGFTPGLAYHSIRAETFWAYYRGANPLFDDRFSGDGIFLCQEISLSPKSGARRFWSAIWDGLLKVFGL